MLDVIPLVVSGKVVGRKVKKQAKKASRTTFFLISAMTKIASYA
jgi:hypothetical protein